MATPFFIFGAELVCCTLASQFGLYLRRRSEVTNEAQADLGVVTAANLTLLALLIGFSFNMATSRYDARKRLEEDEAAAIRGAYLKAELLAPADAAKIEPLLGTYLGQRIAFYNTDEPKELVRLRAATMQQEKTLWDTTRLPAMEKPSSITAMAVGSVDSIIKTHMDTEAAWINRIPPEELLLLAIVALSANFLTGFGARKSKSKLYFVLPILVSIAMFLIADIENPRQGILRIPPDNLQSVQTIVRQ